MKKVCFILLSPLPASFCRGNHYHEFSIMDPVQVLLDFLLDIHVSMRNLQYVLFSLTFIRKFM